ncbi:MAG: class B sortase, partial [Clostridia bacterium]|nr:class B sortase [Clostridia bacterium]
MSKQTKRYSRYYRRRGFFLFGRQVNLKRFIPFMAFLLIAVVSASMLLDYAVDSAKRKKENAQLSEAYSEAFIGEETTAIPTPAPVSTPAPTPQPQLLSKYRSLVGEIPMEAWELYQQNNDLVGWLFIRGVVSLPVVYRDNEYYLNHNFDGEEADGGTLFLDQYHPLAEDTQNLLIHGHNMYDSSMFGIVSNYGKLGNVKGHPIARFSTLYAKEDYVICAVLRVTPDVNSENYFSYVGREKFSNVDAFYDYVNELKRRSLFKIPI